MARADRIDFSGGGELGELIRGFDWRSTPLGAPESWPQNLRMALRIMLTSRQPIWIGWGETLTYFYNDPYKNRSLAAASFRGHRIRMCRHCPFSDARTGRAG